MVMGELKMETELLVIGAGIGGYVAALRAASLGMDVTLVDERKSPGGVCLMEGCIPSKTLIHATTLADAIREGESFGLSVENMSIDHVKLRKRTDEVIEELTRGIGKKLKTKGIELVRGRAKFVSDKEVEILGGQVAGITFRKALIATGSRPRKIPGTEGLKLWYSAQALRIPEVPERLIVIGGGYIGLELGSVYAGLGSEVTVIESRPDLVEVADRDLVSVMLKTCSHKFKNFFPNNRVSKIEETDGEFAVTIADGKVIVGDRVFVSIGREPNTKRLALENAGVQVNDGGWIVVDDTCRTNVSHIYAVGDCVPGPALAHKASREGKVAAEAMSRLPSAFDNRAIPAVVFTDPEIAWVGLTENEVEYSKQKVAIGRFPLKALGRAHTLGRTDGLVKIISNSESGLVLGVGIVAANASDLIAEATLAIEMGATVEDLLTTIHPHPTFSEAIQEAAEAAAERMLKE